MFPFFYVHHYPFAPSGHDDQEQDRAPLHEWQFGDPIQPARHFLLEEINRALDGHASLVVPGFGGGVLMPKPDCLLSEIYLRFALEVAGKTRTPIMCRNPKCETFFHPKHSNQEYCGEPCRWRHNANQKRRRAKSDGN